MLPPGEWEWGWLVVVGFLAVMLIWGFIHSKILGWL